MKPPKISSILVAKHDKSRCKDKNKDEDVHTYKDDM